MNKAVLNPEVQDFIQKNSHSDVAAIGLSKSPFPHVSSKELAQQIDGRKRCETKLPLWYNTSGIYYPEKLALEQCSSQATAKYKAALLLGGKAIDLTGGFGVDASLFAQQGNQVTHCELNGDLSVIAAHNSHVLGLSITHVHTDGIQYLKDARESFATIYIDPSRRVSSRKVFMLQDCEPDVVTELSLLSGCSDRLMIKTAPLLDIQSTIRELDGVTAIHILSVKNECKEVVYIIDKSAAELDPPITCAVLLEKDQVTFSFRTSEEKAFVINQYSAPLAYLYEPDVALLKAGCFKLITREFDVFKLHQHTHLYTSETLQDDFIGRKFKVVSTAEYGTFIKNHTFKKANIICRNFPQDPDKVRKKLRISDGGNDYLLFCTGPNNELLVIHCTRL
ncbi:MAG: hypothetical protein V4721_09500 [Bacteroidota bacterium]